MFKGKNIGIIIFILIVFVIIFVAFKSLSIKQFSGNEPENITVSEEGEWKTYKNDEYGFQIDFPSDWKVAEDFGDNLVPTINIYKPQFSAKPPFTHHSEITNVSIFPKGIPTEGIIGSLKESNIQISEKTTKKIDYLLEDGNVWGTYINFENPPKNWEPWGFLWARAEIENADYSCKRGEETVSMEECNPLLGDEFIRIGEVSSEDRLIEEKIIESFKFK